MCRKERKNKQIMTTIQLGTKHKYRNRKKKEETLGVFYTAFFSEFNCFSSLSTEMVQLSNEK
jgi:hypothetical protein